MKQIYFKFSVLLACLVMGLGSAMAQETKTITVKKQQGAYTATGGFSVSYISKVFTITGTITDAVVTGITVGNTQGISVSLKVGGSTFASGQRKKGQIEISFKSNNWNGDVTITYEPKRSRTVTSGNYGTICLPAAVLADERTGATFYNVSGVTESNGQITGITLSEESGDLVAGKPYIFKADDSEISYYYSGEKVKQPVNASYLVGNLTESKMYLPANGFAYILSSNQLRKVVTENTGYITPERAYIYLAPTTSSPDIPIAPTGAGSVKVLDLNEPIDMATAISEISTSENKVVYNLNGVKMNSNNLPKGIYIRNGRKFIVK